MNKYLKYGLHAAVVIGLVFAGVKYLSGEEIGSALRRFDYFYLPFMLASSSAYFLLKSWRFSMLPRPVSQLPRATAMRAYLSGQAATLLPAGFAARAGLLKQAGVPLEKGSVPTIFSSLTDQVVFMVATLIAAIFFAPARTLAYILLAVVAGVGLLLLIPAVRQVLARLAGWLARKIGVKDKVLAFLENAQELLSWSVLLKVLPVTLLALALEAFTPGLSVRGVGGQIPLPTLLLAYLLPTMLGRLSGLPAGVGVIEAGMVTTLANFSSLGVGGATTATLLFRLATVLYSALVGGAMYLLLWRGDEEGV